MPISGRWLVFEDQHGEVRVPVTADEVSALIEACNVADSGGRPRPPWGGHGRKAHRKLLSLEGGREWVPRDLAAIRERQADD